MSSTIVRAMAFFEQSAIRIRSRFSSTLMARPFAALPYLFEGVLSRGAPGAGAQMIKGQDHISDLGGGRDLSRNLSFSGDIGYGTSVGSSRVHLYKLTFGVGSSLSTWVDVDAEASLPLDFHFQGYISPGVDTISANANDGNPCALESYVLCFASGSVGNTEIKLRWKNVTVDASDILSSAAYGEYSETVSNTFIPTFTTWDEWYFDEMPVIGGQYNKWKLQAWADDYCNFYVGSVTASETRDRSAPESAGTAYFRTLTP